MDEGLMVLFTAYILVLIIILSMIMALLQWKQRRDEQKQRETWKK